MKHICLDGKIMAADEPVIMADDRSYRYGDGLFETMKIVNSKILLASYHFERLFNGLEQLKFHLPKQFTEKKLQEDILHLCQKNSCSSLARVRLSVSRGSGGLYDTGNKLQYIVESWPLNESVNRLNENGLLIDIFPDAWKSCDRFSNLKSANFLSYVMAAQFAKENKLNDCFVLNQHERIADSTIANVFLVKDGKVTTPPLTEGCVAGVTRRLLIEKMQVTELPCTINDLLHADEIFLTNAINGTRWVKQFRDKTYHNETTTKIYLDHLQTISL